MLVVVVVVVAFLPPAFEQIAVIAPACEGDRGTQLSKSDEC